MDDASRKLDPPAQPAGAADDSDEYELEPLDPAVRSAEERHAKEITESAQAAIDVDEIYREAERDRGGEILANWWQNFRFQFQVKHLLIGTAVLAILLTLHRLGWLWHVLAWLVMLSIAGVFLFLKWQETQQQAEAARKRDELYARRRAQLNRVPGSPVVETVASERAPSAAPIAETEHGLSPATPSEPFRIQFSLRQMLIVMTTAAVVMGMIRVLGGPGGTATLLGVVALGGLVVHALGYDPPQIVVFGWWFALVLYVVLSIATVVLVSS